MKIHGLLQGKNLGINLGINFQKRFSLSKETVADNTVQKKPII